MSQYMLTAHRSQLTARVCIPVELPGYFHYGEFGGGALGLRLNKQDSKITLGCSELLL